MTSSSIRLAPLSHLVSYFWKMASEPRTSLSQRLGSLLDEPPRFTEQQGVEADLPPVRTPQAKALNEPIIQFPQKARLPEPFYAHTPPFMDNLTRSTLPTASLSPHIPVKNNSHGQLDQLTAAHLPPKYSPPIVLNSSSPTRTSLDQLRSVSTRDQHQRSPSLGGAVADEPSASPFMSGWSWFAPGGKEDVDPLLQKEDRGETVEEEQQKMHKKYRSTRNPVVFCHGLFGFNSVSVGLSIAPMKFSYWKGIQEVLQANGTQVLVTHVPATSSPIDRAQVLEDQIAELYMGQSVHLIGHSMGGLDCRLVAHKLNKSKYPRFKVLSVTTVATPHRGSHFADHFLQTVGKERMPQVLSWLNMLPNGGGDGKAFEFLTVENIRKFNQETPDDPSVQYFSWGASYDPGLIDTWKYPHSVILEKEGPNDGLVSVNSSRWGKYLGTLSHVNHLDLLTGSTIRFHPATFYLSICDMLAKEVEGIWQDPSESPDAAASVQDKAERGAHIIENEAKASQSELESPQLTTSRTLPASTTSSTAYDTNRHDT
ncbi:alpha/beta-hydrolase [Flagelloscypha sp. PMI_526]|nr:alpha/beta-hydrolase [Flagelloscypha sp. PMI_526]